MMIPRQIPSLFFALFVWSASTSLHAQCERVGWVAAQVPGCGAKIIDLDNGEIVLAVNGGNTLVGGQTISFSSEYVAPSAACAGTNLPAVSLTCISDALPCAADFGYAVDNLNALALSFHADVYSLSQTCFWDFGDGATVSGANVEHTFAQEGYFNVCLTVSSPDGCTSSTCKQVYVSEQNPGWCGYDVQITAVGTELQGSLLPVSVFSGELLSVQWFNSQTGEILGQSPMLNTQLPGYGTYLICAQYQVKSPEGNVCANTLCRQLSVVEPGCIIPELSNPSAVCPTLFAPVCGCNGVSYDNECQAMSAGVTGWWAGDCSSTGFGNCSADFSIEILSGNTQEGYWVRFNNLSSGNYNNSQLDFGDSQPMYEASQWTSITHHYSKGGIYKTNLTVWKNNNCVSSFTQLAITDAGNLDAQVLPDATDYVLPGDANGDHNANMYDLLNVGVGYNALGSPRPYASTAWTPQFAPNWDDATLTGINFKHIDCDGNGIVNEFDPGAIQQNYSPIDTNAVVWNPSAPVIRLDFNQDTIYIDPDNPQTVEISADLIIGAPSKPVFGLYGLALALRYPEYVNHDPATDYYDDSFFGFSNFMLWLPKDNYSRRQLDLGFTRKNNVGTSGYGRVVKVTFRADFIIIIDIIDRTSTNAVPFTVPIKGLKAVDPNGNKKELTVPAVQDTVWIKVMETTRSKDVHLAENIRVYPNPATDFAAVYCGKLQTERIELLNPMGQMLQAQVTNPAQSMHQLDVSTLPPGVYTMRLFTDKGIAEKKLVVQ